MNDINNKSMSNFTSIGLFRTTIESVKHEATYLGKDENGVDQYDETVKLPTLHFTGTVKLHGTNSAVSLDHKNNFVIQSRKRVINMESDNAGFAEYVERNKNAFLGLFDEYKNLLKTNERVVIYGEWCGGNIQKGVAINKLSKRFVIFAVKIIPFKIENDKSTDAYYIKPAKEAINHESNIYNINDYKKFEIDIDFNNPTIANEQIAKWVDEVEKECPFGKSFAVDGIGEGLVFTYYDNESGRRKYIFKAKGEKHAKGGRENRRKKVIKPVDKEFEKKIAKFINEYACKEFRLDQVYTETFDLLNGGKGDIRKMGVFIKGVVQDVVKEEFDIMTEMGIENKDVTKGISKVSKDYLLARLNEEAGL